MTTFFIVSTHWLTQECIGYFDRDDPYWVGPVHVFLSKHEAEEYVRTCPVKQPGTYYIYQINPVVKMEVVMEPMITTSRLDGCDDLEEDYS